MASASLALRKPEASGGWQFGGPRGAAWPASLQRPSTQPTMSIPALSLPLWPQDRASQAEAPALLPLPVAHNCQLMLCTGSHRSPGNSHSGLGHCWPWPLPQACSCPFKTKAPSTEAWTLTTHSLHLGNKVCRPTVCDAARQSFNTHLLCACHRLALERSETPRSRVVGEASACVLGACVPRSVRPRPPGVSSTPALPTPLSTAWGQTVAQANSSQIGGWNRTRSQEPNA